MSRLAASVAAALFLATAVSAQEEASTAASSDTPAVSSGAGQNWSVVSAQTVGEGTHAASATRPAASTRNGHAKPCSGLT